MYMCGTQAAYYQMLLEVVAYCMLVCSQW